MNDQLEKLQADTLHALSEAADVKAVDALEVQALGRKGALAQVLAKIPDLEPAERAGIGTLASQVRATLTQAIAAARSRVEATKPTQTQFDPTWPGIPPSIGHAHPIAAFLDAAVDFFTRLGYAVADGPEVETAAYNFDKLNIPADHPSRDLWDTYYVQSKGANPLLLRTHTSPVQLRYMESHKPPAYVMCPGRVYRHEATDAGHETTFTQIEGLAIDHNLRVTDLIGTLTAFLQHTFGKVKTRVRPHYYPFVEPGMDVDMSCLLCGGKGCAVCKQSGWLEMLGAGMVHPIVLRNMGVDPKKFSGFAFGMGVERLVMLKHGVTDVRQFLSGDLRFLQQFHS